MTGAGTTPFYMRPANELVAEGFERERVARSARAQADVARRFVDAGTIEREPGLMLARWLEAWAEQVEQRLFDTEIDPRLIVGESEG